MKKIITVVVVLVGPSPPAMTTAFITPALPTLTYSLLGQRDEKRKRSASRKRLIAPLNKTGRGALRNGLENAGIDILWPHAS